MLHAFLRQKTLCNRIKQLKLSACREVYISIQASVQKLEPFQSGAYSQAIAEKGSELQIADPYADT